MDAAKPVTTLSIAFRASIADEAQEAYAALTERHGQTDLADADVVVALGGDGFMLETLNQMTPLGKPVVFKPSLMGRAPVPPNWNSVKLLDRPVFDQFERQIDIQPGSAPPANTRSGMI